MYLFIIFPPCPLIHHPQLAQLEVAIREHKQEMVRKVESLQQSLEAKERELREVQQELADKKLKVGRSHRRIYSLSVRCISAQPFKMNWCVINMPMLLPSVTNDKKKSLKFRPVW